MNAENVIPYGKFNHEIATQYGSVKAFKESQKALLNTVKKNSFENGYLAGQKKLLPWLIVNSRMECDIIILTKNTEQPHRKKTMGFCCFVI